MGSSQTVNVMEGDATGMAKDLEDQPGEDRITQAEITGKGAWSTDLRAEGGLGGCE